MLVKFFLRIFLFIMNSSPGFFYTLFFLICYSPLVFLINTRPSFLIFLMIIHFMVTAFLMFGYRLEYQNINRVDHVVERLMRALVRQGIIKEVNKGHEVSDLYKEIQGMKRDYSKLEGLFLQSITIIGILLALGMGLIGFLLMFKKG